MSLDKNSRLAHLSNHLLANTSNTLVTPNTIGDESKQWPEIVDHKPHLKIKLDYYNKQGWGYADTHFVIKDQNTPNVHTVLQGNRYLMSGKEMPNFKSFGEDFAGIDWSTRIHIQQDMPILPPVFNHAFLEELGSDGFSRRSFLKWERIMHSHGSTLMEVFTLRYGKFDRFADVVIYPDTQDHCERIIKLACKHNVVIVPYGGGTNVTNSLQLSTTETRMIVSLDMMRMNKVKWVDKVNQIACVEAGIFGVELEKELKNFGMTCGHEPDSFEFSTLGGWISTRASGMKKNCYGNIEDIVQNIKFVTPAGIYTKLGEWPRISNGPDLNSMILGQEGNFGLITEAVIKIKQIPSKKVYGSVLFPDFELGIKFMEEVGKSGIWAASMRLMDNTQFMFGMALKPREHSKAKQIIDGIKKYYVLNIKGFDQNKLAALTLLFEGTDDEVKFQESHIYGIAAKYGGMKAGEENGIRGYFLTYVVAYIRDFGCNHNFVAESFETSVPWSGVSNLCKSVNKRLVEAARKRGIPSNKVFGTCRVTQVYDTGAAVYTYFGLSYGDMPLAKVMEVYEEIEAECRDEILKCGGCISHHHGVGKVRKRFVKQTMTPFGVEMQQKLKDMFDPNNIFAINNTLYRREGEEKEDLEHVKI